MEHSKLAKRLWILLFAAISAFYLYGLGAIPFVGPDEPRYAEVAREMLARRDFITPTLGGLPWFEKPPLLYWMTAISYRMFGVNEYAARLAPALCGLVTGFFVWWLARSVVRVADPTNDRGSLLPNRAALVFLSSLGALVFSRAASFDMVLTMTLTAALACFSVAQIRQSNENGGPGASRNRQGHLLVLFYLFVGLSLLAKGLLGLIIPFGIIAIYLILRREWPERTLWRSLSWGVPIVLAVAGAWYGPMLQRHGWRFVDQFIIQHHFARFLTNKYHHPQPFYYYLPTLAWLIAPWTIFVAAGVYSAARSRWRDATPMAKLETFAFVWIVFPFLFFSLSGSKLPGYILPILPAAALVIGKRFVGSGETVTDKTLMRISGLLLALIAAGGWWYATRNLGVSEFLASVAALGLVVAAVCALIFPLRSTTFVVLALSFVLITGVAIHSTVAIAARTSVRDLIAQADERGYSATPVFLMLSDDRTAEFYAGGRLAYQSDGEPIRFDGARELGEAIRRSGGVGLVIIETRWQKQLTDYAGLQAELIGSNGPSTLFVVRSR